MVGVRESLYPRKFLSAKLSSLKVIGMNSESCALIHIEPAFFKFLRWLVKLLIDPGGFVDSIFPLSISFNKRDEKSTPGFINVDELQFSSYLANKRESNPIEDDESFLFLRLRLHMISR